MFLEGPPARLSKKQRRHLCVVQNSLSPEIETITSTLATYPDGIDLSKVALPMNNPFDPTEDMYREMLVTHKRKQKKIEQVCYFKIFYVPILYKKKMKYYINVIKSSAKCH